MKNASDTIWSILFVILIGIISIYFLNSIENNLSIRGVNFGFSFLTQPSNLDIADTFLQFSHTDSILYAFVVGLLNTIRAALLAIFFATLIGFLISAIAFIDSKLTTVIYNFYISSIRNLPLVLHGLFWYFVLLTTLPGDDSPIIFFESIFITKNGIQIPWVENGILVIPSMGNFGVVGGFSFTPEFLALLIALSIYTSAFISEIFRAGLLSIDKTYIESASSLGLSKWQVLSKIMVPMSLPIILPSITNQYLKLAKNSSIAVVIGFTDFISVALASTNQTGRSIEIVIIILFVYLTLSLIISLIMKIFEKKYKIQY